MSARTAIRYTFRQSYTKETHFFPTRHNVLVKETDDLVIYGNWHGERTYHPNSDNMNHNVEPQTPLIVPRIRFKQTSLVKPRSLDIRVQSEQERTVAGQLPLIVP